MRLSPPVSTRLEADDLVIGAGAMGMAFADALLAPRHDDGR